MREFLNELVYDIGSVKFEDIPGVQGYYLSQRPDHIAAAEAKASELREKEAQRLLNRLLAK